MIIDIDNKIEKEFDKLNARNSIFKKIKIWFTLIPIISALPICAIFFYLNNKCTFFRLGLVLISFLIFMIFFYLFINPYAKKQLKKLNINYDKGFFKHWANEKYYEYQFMTFRLSLEHNKILTAIEEDNITLLAEYSAYFKAKSENTTINDVFKTFGITTLLFVIPLWTQLLIIIFNLKKENDIVNSIDTSLLFLVVVILLIFMLIFIRESFKEIWNSRNKKMERISEELTNIKWNIKLKNIT